MKPHDDLFREMVSDPAAQRDMIQICLPDLAARIDLDTVTPVDATFTGGKQADLLVSMRDNRGGEHLVYMLVEHKSYHDPLVAVQLYRYLGAIWQQQWIHRESKARGPLPVIHPVVLYHGAAPWTAPLELTGLHRTGDPDAGLDPDTEPFITDLTYRLVDLRTIQPERLRIATRTLAYMIILRHVLRLFRKPVAYKILTIITAPEVKPAVRERLLQYLVDNTGEQNTDVLMTEWKRVGYTVEGGMDIMTMAQELMRRGTVEGHKEGHKEGFKEGLKEATNDVARRMLEKGISVDLIIETTGLTAAQVAALQNGKKK